MFAKSLQTCTVIISWLDWEFKKLNICGKCYWKKWPNILNISPNFWMISPLESQFSSLCTWFHNKQNLAWMVSKVWVCRWYQHILIRMTLNWWQKIGEPRSKVQNLGPPFIPFCPDQNWPMVIENVWVFYWEWYLCF